MQNEQERILKDFLNAFEIYKDNRIVLYGVGKNTKYLLENLGHFRIEGLMDASNEGSEIYGKKVLSIEEVKEKADLVVIVSRTSVLKIIFERIKELEPKIPIYNVGGIRLSDFFISMNPKYYPMPRKEDLLSLTEKYDIISFDLFDTLLMRRTLFPDDVFDLVAERIKGTCIEEKRFKILRKEAEKRANDKCEAPNIDLIYEEFCDLTDVSIETAIRIKDEEFRTENEIICIRKEMLDIYNNLIIAGKKVLLISDMYWPVYFVRKWLRKFDICGYEEIFVSCDYHKTKEDGGLYQYVTDKYGDRILHVGDNEVADIRNANKCGIDSFRVLSAYEMMVNSPLSTLLVHTDSLADRLWIGEFAADALNSPFSFGENRNLLYINSSNKLAEWCFYPLIYGFMKYLMDEIHGSKQDSVILFAARDGYLFKKLYDITVKDAEEFYPESFYLYTSRRAVNVAGLISDDDILAIINRIHYTDSMGSILEKHFGIIPNSDDKEAEEKVSLPNDIDILRSYILGYRNKILENAKRERDLYLKYINSLGIGSREVYLFDLACTGTVSRGLERLLNREFTLICFSTFNIPNEFYNCEDTKRIRSYLGNCNEYDISYVFMRYYKLLEILSGPNEGSFIRIKQDEKKEFSSEIIDSSKFEIIDNMQKKILSDYKRDLITRRIPRKITADGFLGIIGSNYTCISESIKSAFMYDDMSVNERLHEIWGDIV